MIKPGYKTSEFWFTLVSFIFSGAYLVGLLDSNSQKENLIDETSKGLEALVLIIGQLTVLFRYIKGRTEIKKVWWSTASLEERKEVNKKGKKNDKPSRNTKIRTRKINISK
jgi:hypothetical protein